MSIIRFRCISLAAATILAILGAAPGAHAESSGFVTGTEKIGEGVYVFRYGIHRSLFVVSEEGVIVTDPLNAAAAKIYRQEIAKITAAPVTHVIYSHSHWDRVAGGQVFKDEGARFIMQEACAANLLEVNARTPLAVPDIVPPDETFSARLSLTSGDQGIELFDFGPSHDKCHAVMYLPALNALFIPELISTLGASLPVEDITLGTYELSNIVAYFKSVESLAEEQGVTTLIIGHARELLVNGELRLEPATGPVVLLKEQREFWEFSLGYMGELVGKGAQSMFLARIIRYEKFENYVGYDKEAVFMMFRRMITWFATG